jgi:hypothetical protein
MTATISFSFYLCLSKKKLFSYFFFFFLYCTVNTLLLFNTVFLTNIQFSTSKSIIFPCKMEKETKKNRIHNKNMCLFALNIYLRLNFSTINHFAFFFCFPLFLLFSSYSRYIFTIVSYLIGVFIFATIVGQVGNVITNRNANRLEFERLLDGAKTYMRHHKV